MTTAVQELRGKAALVTGGSRGIGLEIARALTDAGVRVGVVSRNGLARSSSSDSLLSLVGNAGSQADASRCTREALQCFGRLDLLVNNAATNPYMGSLMGISASAANKTYAVNQFGVVLWTQAAWQSWMANNGGVVLNVASIGGLRTERDIGFYNATKAAVVHLTAQLAIELAPLVRVNAIAPGLVKTQMSRALWEKNEAEAAEALPLRRLGEPADIAEAAMFLLSSQSRWITGQTLVVDGGALAALRRI